MTTPKYLDARQLAKLLGVSRRTVWNYNYLANRRRAAGTERPWDLPAPDDTFGRSAVWKISTINEWLRTRPGKGIGGGYWARKDAVPQLTKFTEVPPTEPRPPEGSHTAGKS